MKVRKRAPNILRVAGTSVRIADREIRTKKRYLKKGLTASVIGAEENDEEMSKDESNPLLLKSRYSRKTVQERYREEQKEQVAAGKTLEKEKGYEDAIRRKSGRTSSAGGNSKNYTSPKNESNWYQPFKLKSVSENTSSQKAGSQSKKKEIGKQVGKKAVRIAAGATAEVTAGAATGGTSLVISSAVRIATGAARKTKEALQASVIKGGEDGQEKQFAGRSSEGALGLLAAGAVVVMIPILMVIVLLIPVLFLGSVFTLQEMSGANRIVVVARQEITAGEVSDGRIGGQKYKDWYGVDDNWCAIFVSWCADQCGFINMDIMPRTASVDAMKKWYQDREQYHEKDGYEPKKGDIIFFGNGMSHVGIVAEYDVENGIVTTVEGNSGISNTEPYHQGSRVTQRSYPITYKQIIGYATPKYPMAVIDIPEPYGTEYSYMGWQMITSPSSKQYKLREEAGMNFDENGFGKINDRYVIACTSTFGQVGDYIDWELDNGTTIETVIGDIKNQNDEGCNEWGHRNGLCVIEFVVDKKSWYGTGKYPTDFHSEWDGRTIRATNVGSFWK